MSTINAVWEWKMESDAVGNEARVLTARAIPWEGREI